MTETSIRTWACNVASHVVPHTTLLSIVVSALHAQDVPTGPLTQCKWSVIAEGQIMLSFPEVDVEFQAEAFNPSSLRLFLDGLAEGVKSSDAIKALVWGVVALQGGVGDSSASRCLRNLGLPDSLYSTWKSLATGPVDDLEGIAKEAVAYLYARHARSVGLPIGLGDRNSVGTRHKLWPVIQSRLVFDANSGLDVNKAARARMPTVVEVPSGVSPALFVAIHDKDVLAHLLDDYRRVLAARGRRTLAAQGASLSPATAATLQADLDACDLAGLSWITGPGIMDVSSTLVWRDADGLRICASGLCMATQVAAYARAMGAECRLIPDGVIVTGRAWSVAIAGDLTSAVRACTDRPLVELRPAVGGDPLTCAGELHLLGDSEQRVNWASFRVASCIVDRKGAWRIRIVFNSREEKLRWMAQMDKWRLEDDVIESATLRSGGRSVVCDTLITESDSVVVELCEVSHRLIIEWLLNLGA